MKRGKVAKDIIIIGCVTATERDDDDEASAIVISTDRENYIVENNRLGRELLAVEGEEVEVKGRLVIDDNGDKRIRVRTYDFIDDSYLENDDVDYDKEEDQGKNISGRPFFSF